MRSFAFIFRSSAMVGALLIACQPSCPVKRRVASGRRFLVWLDTFAVDLNSRLWTVPLELLGNCDRPASHILAEHADDDRRRIGRSVEQNAASLEWRVPLDPKPRFLQLVHEEVRRRWVASEPDLSSLHG